MHPPLSTANYSFIQLSERDVNEIAQESVEIKREWKQREHGNKRGRYKKRNKKLKSQNNVKGEFSQSTCITGVMPQLDFLVCYTRM